MDIKRVIRLVIFCAMACFSAALQQAAEINGLVGEYYANRTLEGQPVYRLDEKIDFDWENNSPMDNIPADSFSVRWSGFIRVPETGRYTFYVKSDDGARVWIDGELVFDYWLAQSATERSFEIDMVAGKQYSIRVEYYEVNRTASMRLSWESASIAKEVIGRGYITTEASNDASLITNYTHSKNIPFGRYAILSVETSSEGCLIQWQKSVDGKSWEDILGANQKDYETRKFEESDSPVLYRCRVADVSNLNNILYAYTEIIRLTPAEPEVFYVSNSGSDANDGKSWNASFSSLQKAITEAEKIGGGNIWIKAGKYDFSEAVELKSNVYIYGGFAGTEKSLEERVGGNETVISGGGTHRIFTANGIENVKLDHLTLANGKAESEVSTGNAVLYARDSELYMRGITLRNNNSDGQVCADGSTMSISDCEFLNNTGIGVYILNNSKTEIVSSVFDGNLSGGGIWVSKDSSANISYCSILNNSAIGNGGGVCVTDFSTCDIICSKFGMNVAGRQGGGVYVHSSTVRIDGCEFTGNVAESSNGGAIFGECITASISCDIVCNNSTFIGNSGQNGGAVYCNRSYVAFRNATFYGNTARAWNGDAIYIGGKATGTLLNCTIAENNTEGGRGSAISGNVSVKNCIVWGNGRYYGYKQLDISGEVINSVVEGGYEGGTNIITENPLLMPLDYYGGKVKTIGVSFSSCAINAGATQSELGSGVTLPTVDARGADRTAFERPCIGAFEPQASDIHSELSMTTLYGDDYFLEDYEFILSLMMFETRILDSDDLLVEWYKDGELFYSSMDSLILSDMLSTGSATYRAEMTLNGASYSTEEFEIKTVPGVVYVSNSGDDSNDGKTPETAKRSLDVLLREFPYGKPYVINAISNVSDSGEKNSVFTINGMYDIPDGVTLNIGDNCVVKFSDNAGLNVLSGGTLNVGNSVVFTHIADDSIGGDTNADEGRSLPQYDKYTISGSGNISIAEDCDWRYKSFEYGGTLEADQLWIGNRVYLVTSDIIVPSGMSLNILEGAVIKFAPNKRIVVQTGGKIFVNGSYEKQIAFTSIKDDSVGGDSNGDANATLPSMGDWGGILLDGGSGEFRYAKFRYGGGVSGNRYGAAANVFMWNGGSGNFYGCSFLDSKMDGCFSQTGYFENCVFVGNSRGLVSHTSQTRAANCVFASNGSGVFRHGGTLEAVNCIIAYNTTEGSGGDSGVPDVSYSCLYNPVSSNGKWGGGDGIVTEDPLFRNAELEDFTLKVGSPCIDAGAGEFAPESDYFGQPRVQDSHVSGTGTPCENGAIPDIGIHEMTENAMSEVDIAVNWIKYPETVSVGEYIEVVWMGTNVGSKKIQGNCKTTLSLVNESTAEELELGQITNLINLAPSESDEFSAKIKIPQTVRDGAWRIKIVANSNRGIFEGRNTGNNTVTGEAIINVEMPVFEGNSITIGANSSATAKFAAVESTRCVLITAPEGMKIYGGSGYVPNAQTHSSEATNCGNGVYVLTIPASSESFYLSFVNESANIKTANIEITENSLAVFGTSISELPNNGQVTFSVYGSGFGDKSVVTVVGDGVKLPVAGIKYVSPNELSVTLAPEYAQAGEYELAVNDGISGAACGKNLTVLQTSKGPVLETETVLPNGARAGRTFAFTVKCRNAGDANLAIPMVTLRDTGDAGLEFSLDGENFKTGEIKFLSLDNNGGFDAIEAGKEAITTVYCRVPSTANEVKISTRANTPNDVMAKYTNEVDELIDSDLINSEAPEVQIKLKKIQNVLGATNGEYIKNLTDIAKKIAKYAGNIQDVEMLKSLLISEAFKEEAILTYNTNNLADKVLLNTSLKSGKDNLPSETKYVSLYLWNHGWQPLPSLPQEKNKKIIILAHGMNDTISNTRWCDLADRLNAKHPNAYIIGVDWKEKALTYVNAIESAFWTPIVAVYSCQILINSNVSMSDDIITIGHSHGGHVSGRIANYFSAKRHIGLDTSTLISHKYDEPFYPKNIGITEYYRSSKLGGRDDAYANKNYIIVRNGDFSDDLKPELLDDFVWDSRHSYAVDWFTKMIDKYGLDFNKSFDISDQTGGKIKPKKGAFVGIINSDEEFECIYPYNYDDANTASISYPGQRSSWYYMYKSWRGAFDVSRNGTILSSIKENELLYTGETKKLRIVGFQELSNKKSLVDPYDDVKYAATVYLNVLDKNGNWRATIELGKSEFENIGDFEVDMQIPHSYRDSYGMGIAVVQGADSVKMTLAVHVYPKHGGIINNYTCYDIYPNDNILEIPIRIKQGENPVAIINGCSENGFVITKHFEYTQEKYDSLKSSGDTTTSFKLNGDADLSPEKNPIKSWFWHNRDETQNTSIEISKVDSGRYPVALIVKDSAGKYDSVSGFVEVKVFVDGEEEEAPLPESRDPNEMSGPAGVGKDRKVLPGQWLDFKIYFENAPTATAAAQEIHIENMLSEYLDWNTFALGEIVFKNQIATSLSGKNSGSAEVALSDGSQNVRMEFSLDSSTGRAYWYMRSVDPSTADGWPVDPYAGFLPPNDGKGSGEGYVAYRIRVRDDAPADAVINSSASIVFDYNEPMLTDPSWSNVVHAGAPSSPELARLPEVVNGNAALSWTASDFASSYDVYIWRDGEDMPETAYLSDLTGTSVKLDMDFEDGLKYKFAVVAKNRYGSSASNTVESIAKTVATYVDWSAKNLASLVSSDRAKQAVPHGDGVRNFEKYAFGLSGGKAAGFNENGNLYARVCGDGKTRIRYPVRKHMSDAEVKVYYSTDLKNWKSDGISTSEVSSGEEVTIYESSVSGGEPERIYYKLEVVEK